MNISKNQLDALNAVLTVAIAKEDYAEKVSKVLADYKKNASIPGFRKGAVPMSLIQKQYGKAVKIDEVDKLLRESLNNYLVEEKLDILGNPLPKITENFDWDNEELAFEFELGLAPEFTVDLEAKSSVTKFIVEADDKMITEQLERIQKQYGKLISKDVVEEKFDISGTFVNEEKGINNRTTISLDIFHDKSVAKKFIGKKVGDTVELNTKGLFDDDHKLMDYLKVSHDDVHGLDVVVNFVIDEINAVELAELNQDLFDKLFGTGVVSSVEELKTKIKEDAEGQFKQQADQKFLNDVTEFLIENTKFDLPATFLKKWIQTAGEEPLTEDQAADEYAKSEKGLRYQLIEGKIITNHNLQVTFDDLKDYTADLIKNQMAQFGQMNPSDEEVQGIVMRVLSNKDEVKRLSDQLMNQKMLHLFAEKIQAKEKKVNYQEFVKELYGE